MAKKAIKTFLTTWEYQGHFYCETQRGVNCEAIERAFRGGNAGKLIKVRPTKRKHPFYKQLYGYQTTGIKANR